MEDTGSVASLQKKDQLHQTTDLYDIVGDDGDADSVAELEVEATSEKNQHESAKAMRVKVKATDEGSREDTRRLSAKRKEDEIVLSADDDEEDKEDAPTSKKPKLSTRTREQQWISKDEKEQQATFAREIIGIRFFATATSTEGEHEYPFGFFLAVRGLGDIHCLPIIDSMIYKMQ
ncbi:hypothetical protein V7S43_016636 [Phytophthora oleae]|uniref:Uncharacterized protein n=1 Tax=Phytophthora oleae TaxID=2107226 RepID=A0ABD3EVM5_9STRA